MPKKRAIAKKGQRVRKPKSSPRLGIKLSAAERKTLAAMTAALQGKKC